MQGAGLGQGNFFDMMLFREFNFIPEIVKRASAFASTKCGAIFITVHPHICLNSKICTMQCDS